MAENPIIRLINRANSTLILLLPICLFHLNFELTDNEENYLAWAKAYFDPAWMPDSFVFDHWVGHKFLFEFIFGFALSHLDFETVAFFGRFLAFAFLAYALSRLFKAISFTNLESLLVLVVFLSTRQSFFAGEWIFEGVEPKVFAFAFLFLSLAEMVKGNLRKSILLIIFATYMHVLVSAWFCIYFFTALLWRRTSFRELLKLSALYFFGTLPLVLYLIPHVTAGPAKINGIHLNWIYVYFRAPHHLAPFIDGKLNWGFGGILAGLLCFILAIGVHFNVKPQGALKVFNDFNLIIPAFLFTFMIVQYFDPSGGISKYYPFRGAAFFLFFVMVEGVLLAKTRLPDVARSKRVSYSFVAALLVLTLFGLQKNLRHHVLNKQENREWNEMIAHIKQTTNPRSLFFLDQDIHHKLINSFSRKSGRDIFVVRKFIPVEKSKWYEWYQRLQIKIDNDAKMAELKKQYGLDYYLTANAGKKVGEIVFQNAAYTLSRFPD